MLFYISVLTMKLAVAFGTVWGPNLLTVLGLDQNSPWNVDYLENVAQD
jgi:hypothetical protein